MTLSDPFTDDPFAQFNAWLFSTTTDVLNSSISDFEFPLVCYNSLWKVFLNLNFMILRRVNFTQ